jgi:putative hemin transport protein
VTGHVGAVAVGDRWRALRAAKPGIRARDAASELDVSEAELVASTLGDTAVRLQDDPADLLHALASVGRCMALTRNEACVSEVRGRYGGIELGAHAGQVVGEAIDLRVFLSHWKFAFAIDEAHPQRPEREGEGERRRSIHVFDATGTAVHKIYLEADGDAKAWDAIVAARTVRSTAPIAIATAPARRPEKPDAAIDREVLLADWDAMQDTHEFFHLLGKHAVARTQALRLAGTARARQVRPDAIDTLLRDAAETHAKIMIFVGNRGCIQIFSGVPANIVTRGPWLNVMDPGFNLHLRQDLIASSWVVAKPTRTGVVSSLELFDRGGETIALVFRKRDDRERAEDPAWARSLGRLASVAP